MAPEAGIEPALSRLTAERAAITLLWNGSMSGSSGPRDRTRATAFRAQQATATSARRDDGSQAEGPCWSLECGAVDRIRTCFKRIKSPLLLPLSYDGGGSGPRDRTGATAFKAQQASATSARKIEMPRGADDGTRTRTPSLEDSHARHYITSAEKLGACRGNRTHLKRIKNPLPHQSAWHAYKHHSTIQLSVGSLGIEPSELHGALGLRPSPSP